eukprot:COSAG05_NODE_264_length_12674_cov_6.768111_5_plen_85_part_00
MYYYDLVVCSYPSTSDRITHGFVMCIASAMGMAGIILGVGGDNSHRSIGTFFEGALTAGAASDAVDDAVHENIVTAYAAAARQG